MPSTKKMASDWGGEKGGAKPKDEETERQRGVLVASAQSKQRRRHIAAWVVTKKKTEQEVPDLQSRKVRDSADEEVEEARDRER
jgi:hypothetical protein